MALLNTTSCWGFAKTEGNVDLILSLMEKQSKIRARRGGWESSMHRRCVRRRCVPVWAREDAGQQQVPPVRAIQILYLVPLSTSTLILSRLKTMLYVVHHVPVPGVTGRRCWLLCRKRCSQLICAQLLTYQLCLWDPSPPPPPPVFIIGWLLLLKVKEECS